MSRQTTAWADWSADGMDGRTDRQLPMATITISILEDGWMDGWRPLPVSYLPLMDIVFLRQCFYRTWCFGSILQPKRHVDISI